MTESTPIDALTGSGDCYAGFPDIDQRFHVKLRAYVDLAMPLVFRRLGKTVPLVDMRRDGLYPIMYFMEFRGAPQPVAFSRPLRIDFEVRLRHYHPPPEGAPRGTPTSDRFLVDARFTLRGHAGTGRPDDIGPGEGEQDAEPNAHVGTGRVVQVITRPFAPPGQRQVTRLPDAYRRFTAHPWDEPYPSWEALTDVPERFSPPLGADLAPDESTWGVANTDINQHVNIVEYTSALENRQSRMLAATGLPLARHRSVTSRVLFLKPFFAGEPHRIAGTLRRCGPETLFFGGIYKRDQEPGENVRPGVLMRFEGEIEGE